MYISNAGTSANFWQEYLRPGPHMFNSTIYVLN
jgi:hypothetical protein